MVFTSLSNYTATTEIYTLSLHDALPIWVYRPSRAFRRFDRATTRSGRTPTSSSSRIRVVIVDAPTITTRSEEHTSELQSRRDLVCRLLLEKKKRLKKHMKNKE